MITKIIFRISNVFCSDLFHKWILTEFINSSLAMEVDDIYTENDQDNAEPEEDVSNDTYFDLLERNVTLFISQSASQGFL